MSWDELVGDLDDLVFDEFAETVRINGGQPIPVIWEDVYTEFNGMGGTTPKLTFREPIRIKRDDKILRLKSGGVFTVSTNPIRENGTISVLL